MRIKEKVSYKIDIKIMTIIVVFILGLILSLITLTFAVSRRIGAVKIVSKEYSTAFSTSYFDEKIGKEITVWHDKVYYFIVKKQMKILLYIGRLFLKKNLIYIRLE